MKFKSFRVKKGDTVDAATGVDEDATGSNAEVVDSESSRMRKLPALKEEQAPPLPEKPKDAVAAKTEEDIPVYKFGIAHRLDRAVAEHFAEIDSKRSPDLVPLTKQFEETRKRLRQMIGTAKRYQASVRALDLDRMKMAQELAQFAVNSPIAGQVSDTEPSNSNHVSYLSIYQQVSHQVDKYCDKYERDVLDYCVEWEAVVTKRVDAEVIDVKKLRDQYNHYQSKVETLRKKVNGQESKGKSVKDDLVDKLQRNETKLEEASNEYEAAAAPLCSLLEEVVEQAWKDMVPVLQSAMLWEADRSHKEAKLFQQLRGLELGTEPGSKKKSGSSSSSSNNSKPHASPTKKRSSNGGSSKKIAQFNPEAVTPLCCEKEADDAN